ncbi:MAG: YlmC/YmxH family sporulation protein [Bacilli bacterium]|nr:YlmC/YmxH family sporulation protein [Bacilli bacterium]
MRLSDLQDKDVVDLKSGVKIGNIIDIKINYDGNVTSLVLEKKKYSRLFSNNDEIEISFDKIVKIGEDVILIKDI